MLTENIFSIIEKIKTGSSEEARQTWMETVANRPMALEVLRLLGPTGRKKLTEDIRK
jgi:hypothetical protein